MQKQVGDTFMLEAGGEFAPGIECEILELGHDGRIVKARAVVRDDRLLRAGFLIEGDNYIIMEWQWSEN